jgi:hypothetical protein
MAMVTQMESMALKNKPHSMNHSERRKFGAGGILYTPNGFFPSVIVLIMHHRESMASI